MTLDFSYPNVPPNQRGWGQGYPNCDTSHWAPLTAGNGVGFGQVDRRLVKLLQRILNECTKRGYAPKAGQCWGSVCRCSHDSQGNCAESGGRVVPSNHSFGIAIDFNSLDNPFGGSSHKMPWWVAKLFRSYGFRWLGPPIHDWQHFDFAGNPTDAARMLEKAVKARLGEPDLRFKVGSRIFRQLRNALEYVRRRAHQGRDSTIRVVGGD